MTLVPPPVPIHDGRFGPYGGRYVPETLVPALEELAELYDSVRGSEGFWAEYHALLGEIVGRPSPLTAAPRWSERVGCRVMLKREDVNGINRHGKDILNGQLTYSLIIGVIIAAVMGMAFSQIFFPGNQFFLIFFMHLPVYMVIGLILSFIAFGILPAINAFRVSNGKKPWGYPFKIIFFK